MLSQTALNVIVRGIKVKLSRGEELEVILEGYVNLDESDKDKIRELV